VPDGPVPVPLEAGHSRWLVVRTGMATQSDEYEATNSSCHDSTVRICQDSSPSDFGSGDLADSSGPRWASDY